MNKKKLVIGIDVDGVVANTYPRWIDINEEIGNPNKYELSQIYSDRAANDRLFLSLLTRTDLYDKVEPIEGAIPAVQILQRNYRVVFVTSCVLGMADSKWRWLQRYGLLPEGYLQSEALVMIHDKSLIRVDVHIDDSVPQLEKMPDTTQKILFDAPWNQDNTTLYRANWKQIIESWMNKEGVFSESQEAQLV